MNLNKFVSDSAKCKLNMLFRGQNCPFNGMSGNHRAGTTKLSLETSHINPARLSRQLGRIKGGSHERMRMAG